MTANDQGLRLFRNDEGLWLSKAGRISSIIHVAEPWEINSLMEAMAEFLAREDFGE